MAPLVSNKELATTLVFGVDVSPGSKMLPTELRVALAQARTTLGLPAVSYSAPALAAGAVIRAADVNELRGGVK